MSDVEPEDIDSSAKDSKTEQESVKEMEGAAFPVSRKVQERIQQLMMGVQISSGRDQFIDKLNHDHITTVLKNADKSDERDHASKRMSVVAGGILLIALCWLFLWYEKPEHLDAVIAGVLGLAGGYGLGKAAKVEG